MWVYLFFLSLNEGIGIFSVYLFMLFQQKGMFVFLVIFWMIRVQKLLLSELVDGNVNQCLVSVRILLLVSNYLKIQVYFKLVKFVIRVKFDVFVFWR